MTIHPIIARTRRDLLVLGLAALALASGAPRAAQAAPAGGGAAFGSVDINKLQTQSTRKARYDQDLHSLADRLDAAFKQQAASIILTRDEQTELGGLLSKAKQTDADRTRIAVLQAQATKAAQDLTDLQQKKDPTPADTTRLASLTDQYQKGQQALQDVGNQYQTQLKALSDKDNTDFTQSVREAIAAVAQQRGISVVFTSDVAVYTTNDITEDVVKRINK